MADVVNRIVPSSAGMDRVSWQGSKHREKKDSGNPKTPSPIPDDSVTSAGKGDHQPAGDDLEKEKGHRLNVSV